MGNTFIKDHAFLNVQLDGMAMLLDGVSSAAADAILVQELETLA